MDLWKSPKQFVSEMMDSIELHVIRLPATQWIDISDNTSEATTITDAASRPSSEETIRNLGPLQSWWNSHVSAIVPQNTDVRDHFGKLVWLSLCEVLSPGTRLREEYIILTPI